MKAALAAVLLALAGCSSTPVLLPEPAGPRSAAAPDSTPDLPARLSAEQAGDVTVHAIGLVGTPYRFGGNTPDTGFDCSGLIAYVYRHSAGVVTPRTVAALVDWGQPVPAAMRRTGDLVLFTLKGVTSHAGIYVGEGRFVHAPSKGGEVRLDALDSSYWARQQVSYRRP